jgi:hypothetical protein
MNWATLACALASTGWILQPEHHPAGGHPQAPRPAPDWPQPRQADVASLDAIVKAFYDSTAGPAGQARDWDRYRSLFLPEARLIPARPSPDGGAGAMFLGVNDFVDANRKYFEKGGFFDAEVARRVEEFGNIAHVWSTYESRHVREAPEPYIRGINSIQLLKDGARWWIVSVYWDYERPESLIPGRYLRPD